MAEQLEDIAPQTEIPQDEPYVKKVYSDMQSRYGANNIIPFDQFSKKISTDKNYATQVHDDMAKQYGANNIISVDDFFNNVKKKDTTLLPSSGGGTTLPSQNTKFDFNSTFPQANVNQSSRTDNTSVSQPHQSQQIEKIVKSLPVLKANAVKNTTLNLLSQQGKVPLEGSNDYNQLAPIVDQNLKDEDWMPSGLVPQHKEQIRQQAIQDFASSNKEKPEDVEANIKSGKYLLDNGKVKEKGGFVDNFGQGVKDFVDNVGLAMNISAAQGKGNNNEIKYHLNQFNDKKRYDREFGADDIAGKSGKLIGGLVPYVAGGAVMPFADVPMMGFSNMGAMQQEIWNDHKLTEDEKIKAINNTSTDAFMTGSLQGAAFHGMGEEGAAAKNPTASKLLSEYAPTAALKKTFAQKVYTGFGDLLKTTPQDVAKAAAIGGGTEALNTISKSNAGLNVDFSKVPEAALEMGTLDLLMKTPKVLTTAFGTLSEAKNLGYDKTNPEWYNQYSKQTQDALNNIVAAPKPIYDEAVSQLDKSPDPAAAKAKAKIEEFRGYYNDLPSDLPKEVKDKALHIIQLKSEAQEQSDKVTEPGIKSHYAKRASAYDKLLDQLLTDSNVDEKSEPLLTKRFAESGVPALQHEELSNKQKEGIEVPEDYGEATVDEKGEGENKTYVPKAVYFEKDGANITLSKPIKIEDSKTYSDKDKAQVAADAALKEHFYRSPNGNGMAEHDKPVAKDISSPKIKNDGNQETDAQTQEVGSNQSAKEGAGNTVPSTELTDEEKLYGRKDDGKKADNSLGKRIIEPSKPISEMNSDELYNYATDYRKALKAQDKEFEGKTEAEKQAGGYNDVRDEVENIRDAAIRVNFVENSENISDLASSVKSTLSNMKDKEPNEYELSILNAAKNKSVELGIPTNDLIKELALKVSSQYKDIEDAELMVKTTLEKLLPKNETTQDTKQAEAQIAEHTKPIENIQPTSEGTDSKENTAGVGGKEPPTETVDNDGDGTEYTSLKKRIYDTERDAEGKPVMDTTTGKSAVERANETKAKIESGEISQQEITDIATALANKTDINTKLKPEEIEHVLAYDKVRLNKEGRQISKDLVDAQKEGNKEKEADLLFKDAQNQILREENYRATKNLNAEWGRQGQAIQLSIDNDYSFEHLKDRIGKALNDEDIPKATRDKLKELSDKIGDLQDKVDEHAKKLKEHEDALKKSEDAKLLLEEENSRLKAQAELDNKKEESENKRQQKKGDLAKQKKDTIEQIKARYNKLRGSANSGLNFNLLELAPDIAKLARIHVEEGVIKIEELVDKMYDDLKDFIPNLSKRELRDVFSGYGKLQKLSDDKIDIELGKLKAHGKALSGLEDVVEKNQAPLRSGTYHREPTSEVKALRKQINDEMRKRGIDIRKVKDPEKVWKTALESFKTKTENRIKYLENVKGINDIERFKKEQEKVKLKLDKEASDLKTKVQAEKNRVDGLVKQYEFNNWSKFDKALHYANQFSKGVLISNPAILVKILGSVIWRGATKWATASIKYGVSKAIPSVSKLEGINTSRDLADHISKYYSTMFSKENWQGVKDAFKNKGAGEDLLYGKKYSKNEIPQYSFKTNWGNPAKALADVSKASFFWTLRALEKNAQLHGAEKSAASKPAFEAYKQTIQRNFDRNRTDISTSLIKEGLLPKEFSNEHVQEMVNQLAFQKSLREKFMQDDKISNAQKVLEAHFRNSGNIGVAEGVNALLPVTKIGSNFIGEALEQHPIIGAIPQLKNIFNLALKGENSLTQKQKYNVLRALTNQGVGLACYVAGAYLYQSINPFYQSSSRKYADKNGKELPADENNIGVIPSLLSHVPYATTFRAGASHAWVWHQYDQAHPDEGVMSKFFSTSVDALSENLRGELAASPYISMGESTLAPLLGHGDAGKAFANLVKSRLPFSSTAGELAQGKVPLLNKIAPDLSKKVGESVGLHQETDKPSPKGFLQNMEMGIPGLRQNVPTKQQAKNIEAAKKGIKDPEILKERIREIMDHKNLQD